MLMCDCSGAMLLPELVQVGANGLLSLTENFPVPPLLSMSLFGRDYSRDPPGPGQFCPHF